MMLLLASRAFVRRVWSMSGEGVIDVVTTHESETPERILKRKTLDSSRRRAGGDERSYRLFDPALDLPFYVV